MTTCNINFTEESNSLAYGIYQDLLKDGVSCGVLDGGYALINYAGIHCPNKEERSCFVGKSDGVVTSNDVMEYALDNYEKYRQIIEGGLGEPLPFVLDDLDPKTTFDADIRKQVQSATNELKRIIKTKGIKEGSEEYKELLAVGLFWFTVFPRKNKTNDAAKISQFFENKINNNGLKEFWEYLEEHGGVHIDTGDFTEEYAALDALKYNRGECTEKSKILFATLKMAGLQPIFIHEDLSKDETVDPQIRKDAKVKGMFHVCIGIYIKGKIRLLDPSIMNSNMDYKHYIPLSLRQYLGTDYSSLGHLWTQKSETDKALANLTRAIEIDPESAMAWNNRGNAWVEKGELDKAIADFTRAIEIDPKFAGAWNNCGNVWLEKGELDKAIADYTRAIEIDPELAITWSNRCNAWTQKNELDKALTDCKRSLEIDSEFAAAYYHCGQVWTKKDKLDEAVINFTKAWEIDPGFLNTAITDFTKLIEAKPEFAGAYYIRGIARMKKGQLDEAMADLTRTTQIASTFADAYNYLGGVLMQKGENDNAIDTFTKVLEIDPNFVGAYYNRGNIWRMKGDLNKAIADLTRAIDINPKYGWAYYMRGLCWLEKNDFKNAVDDFLSILQLEKNINLSEFVDWLSGELKPFWQKHGNNKISDTFDKETGLDIANVETYVILSYTLWQNGSKKEAIERFQTVADSISFKNKPSKSTMIFLKQILNAMPKEMQKDKEAKKALNSLQKKMK